MRFMLGSLRPNWKKVVTGLVLALTIIFGSITEVFDYIDALSGQQLRNLTLNALQVILVTIGVTGLLILAYDITKSKERGFNWSHGVRCRKCRHLFDFRHTAEKVTLNKNLSSATVVCPYCNYKGAYQRKEWVQNLYDRQQS